MLQTASLVPRRIFPAHSLLLCLLLLATVGVSGESTVKNRIWGANRHSSSPTETDSEKTTNATNIEVPSWKKNLPAPLSRKGSKTLQRLLLGNTVVYLLGTAHVSNDSSADVSLLLNTVHPDVLFLELCDARIPMLSEPPKVNSTLKFWERVEEVQRQGVMSSRMAAISTVLLTQVQEDYADSLGVELGGEFRVAHQYWKQQCLLGPDSRRGGRVRSTSGAPHLILGDRPLHLTLRRAWESLGVWQKIKVMGGLLWSCFQKPNPDELRKWMQSILQEDTDVLTESMAELRKHFPTLETVIIRERDAYMACKLYQCCRLLSRQSRSGKEIVVVAIVGAGHLEGICQWLTDGNGHSPEDIIRGLITTKKQKDAHQLQQENSLIYEVTELNEMPDGDFMWADSKPSES